MRKISIFAALIATALSCVPATQFREVDKKRDAIQENRDEIFAENERLTVENREMKAMINQVEEQREKFVEDSIRLYREIDKAKSEINTLTRKYNDLQESHDALLRGNARETRRLLSELQTAQEDLARKQQTLEDLQGNVSEQRQAVTRLRAEIEARNARLMELEDMLNRKDQLMNELRQTVADALLGFEGQGLTVTQKNGKVYVSLQNKLLFGSGSTVVDSEGQRALRQLAAVLAQNPDIDIMIEGHTDDVPFRQGSSIKDNWDLSVLRATSIVRILLDAQRIDPKRITVAGRGEYLPVDPADTPEARARNRRTEIILSPDLDELYRILDLQ
ncbi:MAG: OmpA family protein [Bacteroidales bacterium]|nr:OmpA family protein [Bacteroidales bacterium]MDT8432729.1 OmpA family protein [Bacteroidales bacterium]